MIQIASIHQSQKETLQLEPSFLKKSWPHLGHTRDLVSIGENHCALGHILSYIFMIGERYKFSKTWLDEDDAGYHLLSISFWNNFLMRIEEPYPLRTSWNNDKMIKIACSCINLSTLLIKTFVYLHIVVLVVTLCDVYYEVAK